MEKKLIKRDILAEILKYIDDYQVLVLHGARQVGKTHLLYLLQNFLSERGDQTYFFDLEDSRQVERLDQGIESFLAYLEATGGFKLKQFDENGQRLYIFIDEIQYLKNPSSFLKLLVDHHRYLKLIVSGSSSFDIKRKFTDSLVGRTFDFEIFNLSFKEFLQFKEIGYNLKNVRGALLLPELTNLYREYVVYGGYPGVVLENTVEKKEKNLQQIIDTYVRKDIRDLAQIRDIEKFNNLLKLLAGQSGQLLSVNALANTLKSSSKTIQEYLAILENTYVIKIVQPFSHSAKVRVVKSPKVFFYDTGLLQMLRQRQLAQELVGDLFETSVFAELVKKYGRQEIYFWRTPNQTEVDFVVDKRGEIKPFEVKVNFNNFNKKAILSFCQKYKINDYKVIGLTGEARDEHFIYPWEIGG